MSKRIIHQIAYCVECLYLEQDYKIAKAAGKTHAKTTGHRVLLETAYAEDLKPN